MEQEVYDKYIRMKKRGFSRLISHYPSIEIEEDDIDYYAFVKADDQQIIIRCGPPPIIYLIVFIISNIFALPLIHLGFSKCSSEGFILGFASIVVFWLPGWYCLYLYIKKPEISLTFDREKQKITFKTCIFIPKIFGPYSLDEVAADYGIISKYGDTTITFAGKYGGFLQCDLLASRCSKIIKRYIQSCSFVLWYMDKNRPLPPVTVLEPYREKDDERRKNEGYPKPLFPTTFEFREEAEKLGVKIEDEESYPEIKERKIPARKLHKKPHRSKNK